MLSGNNSKTKNNIFIERQSIRVPPICAKLGNCLFFRFLVDLCVFKCPLECRELLVGINLFLAIHFSPSIFAVDIAQIHFGTVIARAAQVSLKRTD